jgi:hypothetical protein
VYQCCSTYQYFISFYCQIIFHSVNIPHFLLIYHICLSSLLLWKMLERIMLTLLIHLGILSSEQHQFFPSWKCFSIYSCPLFFHFNYAL